MIDSLVGLVEEHVGLDGSRFSESILNAGTLRVLHNRMW